MIQTETKENVLKVSLWWVAAVVLAMVSLGVLGGVLAVQVWPTTSIPLNGAPTQLVSTTQEVTVSPSTAAVELVAQVDRSVVLLAVDSAELTPIATGVILTNDGLLVTANLKPEKSMVGIDSSGRRLKLESVGADDLFGLYYFRVVDNVVSPIDLRSDKALVAESWLTVSRSVPSMQPRADTFQVKEAVLPPELVAPGVQRLIRGNALADAWLKGAPVIDDNGALGGLLVTPTAGLVLSAHDVRASLQRVSEGQREMNPLDEIGLSLKYTFVNSESELSQRFGGVVQQVVSKSPAALATFKTGDVIIEIGGEKLGWLERVDEKLLASQPLDVTVVRGGKTLTLTLYQGTADERTE